MLRVHAQKLGDIAILGLRGGVVTGDTTPLRSKMESLTGVNTIVLDFARVNRIDAGGLGVLLELREQTKARGVEFKLMNVTRLVKQVLEITRLDAVFEISSESELIRATGAAAAAGVFFVRGGHNEGCDHGV